MTSTGAVPVRVYVDGSPYQVGDIVRVVRAIDVEVHDISSYVGRLGLVEYLEYSCGCGQSLPADPMIGVRFTGGAEPEEFWKNELQFELPGRLRLAVKDAA